MSIDNFTGVYREYYNKKKPIIKSEVFMLNGKRNGILKSYHKNGQLKEEVNYIDDKMNGIYKLYHKNGELDEEVNYIDGKKIIYF